MGKEHAYPELFYKDDKAIESKENIANMFNRFFTSVGPDLAKQIPNKLTLLLVHLYSII